MRNLKQILQDRQEHKTIERILSEDNHNFF